MTITNLKPFIAGNWKMNGSITEARELVQSIHRALSESPPDAEIVIIPPLTAIGALKDLIGNSSFKLGAQNVFWEDRGAYTGEVSPPMLKDAGCEYIIIGHSERRQYFGETDATVNKKIRASLSHGLTPIMCIGETLEEREKEKTIETVERQIVEGLTDIALKN